MERSDHPVMKYKKVDVGRIAGLSSYELALRHGFVGTEEEYIAKEQKTYTDMVNYADDSVKEMNDLISSVSESIQGEGIAEVIASRGEYDVLKERLDASDDTIDTIIRRLSTVTGGDIVKDAVIDDEGYLVLSLKSATEDAVHGNIELRKTESQIQWRSNGYKEWTTLIYIRELMPRIDKVKINMIDYTDEPSGFMEGDPNHQTLTLNIPSGRDGAQILDAQLREDGYLYMTVANNDTVLSKAHEIINGVPILSIGEVNTVEYDEGASASITGTPTNPKLNLNIPRGKTTKLNRAYLGSDGFLVFDYDENE